MSLLIQCYSIITPKTRSKSKYKMLSNILFSLFLRRYAGVTMLFAAFFKGNSLKEMVVQFQKT